MEIQKISIEELLFDRQESFNDLVSILIAKSLNAPFDEKRLLGNLNIIETIRIECKRRGFDPAQFDQVVKVLKNGNDR
jgi:hypothetical protein